MILPLDRLPLGTITVLLSGVFSTVLKIWMLSTVPETPCASMYSPARNGRRNRIRAPPAKLARLPCRARPTARPAAPSTAINDVVSIPTMPATLISSSTLSAMEASEPMNPCSVGSTLRLLMTPFIAFIRRPISHQPTSSVNSASASLLPYSINSGNQASSSPRSVFMTSSIPASFSRR